MSWLLTHMWMALAAVGLFALLLGWSVRGILLVGKLRTARVDRDVSRTELEQARAEIEGLYAAQRNTAPGASDPALKAELNVREKRLAELSSELARSKAELESLKTGAGRGSATAAAAAPARPAAIAADEEPSLLWRNRHLESRVRHLEAALHQPAVAATTIAGAAAVAGMAHEPDATQTDKLKWQADVLKQRVEALEAELAAQPAAIASPAQPVAGADANEELARLRWRNRFLEGRIAYFEGDSASAPDDVPEAVDEPLTDDGAELVSATDAILTELEQADAAADADETDLADEFEDEAEADDDDEAESDGDDEVDEDEDGVEEDEDDAADFDDDLEADDEQDDDAVSDDESDEDDEYEDDDESEDGESEDDADSDDESDDDNDADDDETDDDDDDDAEADDDSEEGDIDEDEADDALDEDDLDSGDEDDAGEAEDEFEAERPIALAKPVADAPDDLTIIGGIGPKIQEVLNELGIFHYDQIAAWSPENIAWVDHHLNFSGRISREGWVEQAAILSGDVADE
jgi:predicted flap endonuclease-1-like 5' DNA nuclease